MTVKYTKEQLHNVDKSFLIQLLLQQQEQLETITKELHASNEKMEDTSQICFREVDGTIVFFNEAEAVCDLNAAEPEDLELKPSKQVKRKGKKQIFPGFRSDESTIICLRRNWKQNSVSMCGNSCRIPFPQNIILSLLR